MDEWMDVKEMQPGINSRHYRVTVQVGDEKPWVTSCFWDGERFCVTAPAIVTAWWPERWHPVPEAGAMGVYLAPEELDRWISVEERLPEVGKSVSVAYHPNQEGKPAIGRVEQVKEGRPYWYCRHLSGNWFTTLFVTHWQPLPGPPLEPKKKPKPRGNPPYYVRQERATKTRSSHWVLMHEEYGLVCELPWTESPQFLCDRLNENWYRGQGECEKADAPEAPKLLPFYMQPGSWLCPIHTVYLRGYGRIIALMDRRKAQSLCHELNHAWDLDLDKESTDV